MNGEYLAEVSTVGKKKSISVGVEILSHLRAVPQQSGANLSSISLVFAPIKKQRLKILIEKATEIGVDRLVPVITQRTVADWEMSGAISSSLPSSPTVLPGRSVESVRGTIIESCEQCVNG
jgi:16S rRNA U1498 N3-methylase RsmE